MQQETAAFKTKFSTGLRYARLGWGLTQADLANRLDESPSVIASWESGANGPRRAKLGKIAQLFKVYIDPITGDWRTAESAPSPMTARESSGPPAADMSWMLRDYSPDELIAKAVKALTDRELEYAERLRRARVFLAELEQRVATTPGDAAARPTSSDPIYAVAVASMEAAEQLAGIRGSGRKSPAAAPTGHKSGTVSGAGKG